MSKKYDEKFFDISYFYDHITAHVPLADTENIAVRLKDFSTYVNDKF